MALAMVCETITCKSTYARSESGDFFKAPPCFIRVCVPKMTRCSMLTPASSCSDEEFIRLSLVRRSHSIGIGAPGERRSTTASGHRRRLAVGCTPQFIACQTLQFFASARKGANRQPGQFPTHPQLCTPRAELSHGMPAHNYLRYYKGSCPGRTLSRLPRQIHAAGQLTMTAQEFAAYTGLSN